MNTEPRTKLGPEQLLTEYYGLEVKSHTACFSGQGENLCASVSSAIKWGHKCTYLISCDEN